MNEIAVIEIKYELPKVSYDLTELNAQVQEIKNTYEGLVLKEEDVASIKKEIASLNKISKAINDKKIAIAKEIKKPITDFESEIKELVSTIETVSKDLKSQVDVYAELQKDNKRQEILSLPEWVDEFMTFDDKWLTSAYSIAKVKTDLAEQKNNFQNQSLLIQTTCKALGLETTKYYGLLMEHQDITSIIDTITNDNEVKNTYQNQAPIAVAVPKITVEDTKDTDIYEYVLKISGSRTQLKMLKEYLEQNNIKYEKV